MNNKGFMFIETIVMVVILSVGLLVLYSSYNNSIAFEKTRLSYDDTPYIYRTFYITKFLQENTDINSSLDELLEEKAIRIIGTETSELFDDDATENKFNGIKSKFHFYKILLVSSDIRNSDDEKYNDLDLSNKFKKYINSLDYNNESGDKKYYIIVEFAEKLGSSNEDNSDGILECNPNEQESDCKVSYASIEIKKGAIVTPDDIDPGGDQPEPIQVGCTINKESDNPLSLSLSVNQPSFIIDKWYYKINNGNETSTSSNTIIISDLAAGTNFTVSAYAKDANSNQTDACTYSGKIEATEWILDDSTNNPLPVTIVLSGYYKLQVWGAQGGSGKSSAYIGGKGGYSEGVVKLSAGNTIYMYVGGQGIAGDYGSGYKDGGTNGGGKSGYKNGGSGGGASDIRINEDSLYARIIVAGGGGGASMSTNGPAGGGTAGIEGGSKPGYATSGGTGGTVTFGTRGSDGTFGKGGDAATVAANTNCAGGGGGGWYGGGGGGGATFANYDSTGGGGSGFVYTSSTAANVPTGWKLNSTYYLSSARTVAGNTSFPSTSGGTETGHEGNGYARIIYCGDSASDCS